jgi:hypothetical protein
MGENTEKRENVPPQRRLGKVRVTGQLLFGEMLKLGEGHELRGARIVTNYNPFDLELIIEGPRMPLCPPGKAISSVSLGFARGEPMARVFPRKGLDLVERTIRIDGGD